MQPKIERSQPTLDVLVDSIAFVSKGDSARDGTSRWIPLSLLFLVGIGFFLIGFLLVFLGSAGPISSGGCLFWPFPVIVVCGLGTGGGPFLLIGVFAAVLISLTVVLGWWTRKPGDEGSPAAVPSEVRESYSQYFRSTNPGSGYFMERTRTKESRAAESPHSGLGSLDIQPGQRKPHKKFLRVVAPRRRSGLGVRILVDPAVLSLLNPAVRPSAKGRV